MPRINTTPDVILQQIKARIIAQVAGATSSTCWISDDPDAVPAPAPSDVWFVVAPQVDGKFDEPMFDGGGQAQTTVNTGVSVTVHNVNMLDEVGKAEVFFTGATKGLLPAAKPVLAALAGHDLLDTSGNQILAQPLFPQNFNVVRDTVNKRGSIMLVFKVVFDWDLS